MTARYIFYILAEVLLISGLSAVALADTISITPASVTVNQGFSTEFQVTLDNAPEDISAYYLKITLQNPAIAEIVGVTHPFWVILNENPGVSQDQVIIAGGDTNLLIDMNISDIDVDSFLMTNGSTGSSDIGPLVEMNITDIPLGILTIRGDNEGSSDITMQILLIGADGGNTLPVTVNTACITVTGSYSNGTESTGGGETPGRSNTTTIISFGNVNKTTLPTHMIISPVTTITTTKPTSARMAGVKPEVTDSAESMVVHPDSTLSTGVSSFPFLLPVIAGIVIMVGSAALVLYLAVKKKI